MTALHTLVAGGLRIKRIVRGSTSSDGSIDIGAYDPQKTIITSSCANGTSTQGSSSAYYATNWAAYLFGGQFIGIQKGKSGNSPIDPILYYEVVEFE